ncbi:unnamed protein product [Candidula unifasciata]|uniref:FAD-dependent oxidoreductase domain-containing protein 1 n=1 Tax=Candidula unifasciata TaxID=100452 RepID=A0A8S3YKG5_9EUPU|nr:unnamed protein product [Candidula unifasciata]
MSCPMLRSLCRSTLKSVLLKTHHCKQFVKLRSSLGSARFVTTDESDKPDVQKRIPRAGHFRSAWDVMKEEFEGMKTMKPPGTVVPRETDVLIIGGGVVGSSVAYWLKHEDPAGSNVTVIERDPVYTRASSMLSWEGINFRSSIPENVQLSLYTSDFLRDIKQHLNVLHEASPDVQFNHQGYLLLAEEKDAERLAEDVVMQQDLGARVVLLTKRQLTERYPWMDFEGIECGSLGLEGEGWLDPWSYLRALKQKNISLGVKYVHGELTGFELVEIETDGPVKFKLDAGVTRTPDGREHETKFCLAINCAGPWAADVAEMARVGTGEGDLAVPLPVEPRKRYAFVNHLPSGPKLDCPLVKDPSGLFFHREGFGGHYVCGLDPVSEVDEPVIANFEVDFGFYDEKVLPKLTKRVPEFSKSNLKTAWAGYKDHNIVDQSPVIGPHPYLRNFLFANGLEGQGLQYSAGIGRALMEYILDNGYKVAKLDRFHFDRFLVDDPEQEQLTG